MHFPGTWFITANHCHSAKKTLASTTKRREEEKKREMYIKRKEEKWGDEDTSPKLKAV